MNLQSFVQKWKTASGLTERAACQQHFLDLCDLLGEKKPADVDPTGTSFTFEKGVTTTENRKGVADVWRRGCFGWEYKGKHKDLGAAYTQLLKYREPARRPVQEDGLRRALWRGRDRPIQRRAVRRRQFTR